MKTILKPLAVMALVAVLAACGSDKSSDRMFAMLLSTFKSSSAKAGQTAPVTRTHVAGFPNPLILAALEARGEALLGVSATVGPYQTWRSADGVSFTLRRGVLVSTRGLGEDLMSANVPDIRSVRGKSAHIAYYLDGSESTYSVIYNCTVAVAGKVSVVVLEKSYAVRQITETCQSGDRRIQNIFWVGADQNIRKSRQFVSPSVGYVTLQRVID